MSKRTKGEKQLESIENLTEALKSLYPFVMRGVVVMWLYIGFILFVMLRSL
jgi:hypothetical protein